MRCIYSGDICENRVKHEVFETKVDSGDSLSYRIHPGEMRLIARFCEGNAPSSKPLFRELGEIERKVESNFSWFLPIAAAVFFQITGKKPYKQANSRPAPPSSPSPQWGSRSLSLGFPLFLKGQFFLNTFNVFARVRLCFATAQIE